MYRDVEVEGREIVFNFYEQSTSTVFKTIQERVIQALTTLTAAFLAWAFFGAAFLATFLAPAFLVAFLAWAFLGAACFFACAAAALAKRERQVSNCGIERKGSPRQSIIKAYTLRLDGSRLAPGRSIVRSLTHSSHLESGWD